MADNYLEKRYEEVFGAGAKPSAPTLPARKSLETLLHRNRSFRGYDKSYEVHLRQLEAIIAVNPMLGSAKNRQCLRFHPVTKGPESEKVFSCLHFGGAAPGVPLPFPGTEPEAFIVVCSTVGETPSVCIDLGISLQSMMLKAVDMGLGGIIIRNIERGRLQDELGLALEPLAVLVIGKPAEKIELVPVHAGDDLKYYRRDGVHYVPKLTAEDLTI
ncbi:MAG: nitroreductase family protein [Bacteroidales bacterium]|nr:nitroreductase family protein [Bacteroidales bacterium]